MEGIKKREKKKEMGEDERMREEKEIEKKTENYMEEIKRLVEKKKKELASQLELVWLDRIDRIDRDEQVQTKKDMRKQILREIEIEKEEEEYKRRMRK